MNSKPKKLTVTFPLYGQHKMFERALIALTHQTYTDFKIIGIDDKSPQNFENLVSQFKNKLDISIVYNENNLGAMGNIWQSIQIATDSPYLLSHHADDFLKADYLEQAIKILDNKPEVSFVVTGPVWVPVDHPYNYQTLGNVTIDYFNSAEFARNVLQFAPYIFGSVVYRREHLINDWRFHSMNTYCDRYFLGEILRTQKTFGAYINGNGIIEHDHSQDEQDTRSLSLNEDHAINLMRFYKKLLQGYYQKKLIEKIITNNLLYYYSNFTKKSNLIIFYKKQQPYNLIQIQRIRLLGLYAIFMSLFTDTIKKNIFNILRRLNKM